MKVKVCGLRRREDAALAVGLGATHLGVVLAPDSPRGARLGEVRAVAEVAGDAAVVLVFRRPDHADVLAAAEAAGVRRVQVHGVDRAFVDGLERAGLIAHRVYPVAAGARALPAFEPEPTPDRPAVLDRGDGGTGTPFDWNLLGARAPAGAFVAGGITPDNVRALLARGPWGIDVSSGVERAPGVKDHDALRRLFERLEEGR